MARSRFRWCGWAALVLVAVAAPAGAQTFKIQCPNSTALHPRVAPTAGNPTGANPGIKCQQISGGDGFTTMGDGTQTYLFAFGPLSGLRDIYEGLPGTQTASAFNLETPTGVGTPSSLVGVPNDEFNFNGAIGLVPDPEAPAPCPGVTTPDGGCLDGHVDPRPIMDVGVLNGSHPAPLMAIDEDDEFFLTLTNVGQIMRPDLFEQHTVHFHGYPNASAFYDGVPDASPAINIGGSFTYYYLAPDAGTYFWHCHITPPEHLQMGMVGQIYVRPRQNRVTPGADLGVALKAQQSDKRTKCSDDILCSNPMPNNADPGTGATNVHHVAGARYAYNDGDGSTAYDVEYPLQMHGFDPNFHFVGMTFNPESFIDLKDKYFMLNGRSYPDTINPAPLSTQAADGVERFSQPMRALVNIPAGGRALLRISDLNITQFHTLASLGIPMRVIGVNAKLLRDQDGKNMDYYTNSITLGGGESIDVILDACRQRDASGACTTPYGVGETYYLYTPQLDQLSNDAENFGGMMTEIHICSSVDPTTRLCS